MFGMMRRMMEEVAPIVRATPAEAITALPAKAAGT